RRIKTVSVSIPCIAGPQTNINAMLTLQEHGIQKVPNSTASFDNIPVESIALSGAQNDSGAFELNLKDERYLPFEGRGAISKWRLELTDAIPQFDYNTIADVILHMKYTARYDGNQA